MLPPEVPQELHEGRFNIRAGNTLCCALNGLVNGLGFDAERAESAVKGNGDMCFHRSVCEAGIEPAWIVFSSRNGKLAGYRLLLAFQARFAGPQNQFDRVQGHALRQEAHRLQSSNHMLRQIALGKFSSCVCVNQ